MLPNGTTVTNGFDDAHQLLSRLHKKTDATTIGSFLYGYDNSGNRTNMTTLEGVNAYSYNSNNWLTAATYPGGSSQQFFYDPVGNRTNLIEITGAVTNTTRSTIGAANRLASSFSSSSSSSAVLTNLYTYDAAGRLTNQFVGTQARRYSYTYRSQLSSLTDTNTFTFTYDFDGDGNRTKQSGSGCLTTKFVYDGPNVVLDLNASNQVVHAYVNGMGIDQPVERIAFLNGTQLSALNSRLVFHTDALGSVVLMTDSGQLTAKSYSYQAFGKIRTETGTAIFNRQTYTAREALGDTIGSYYYRWRVMDPNVGRFTSEDPLGFVDGPSLYVYVGNRPLLLLDPSGLYTFPSFSILSCPPGQVWKFNWESAGYTSASDCANKIWNEAQSSVPPVGQISGGALILAVDLLIKTPVGSVTFIAGQSVSYYILYVWCKGGSCQCPAP